MQLGRVACHVEQPGHARFVRRGLQIRMREVDARIHDANHDALAGAAIVVITATAITTATNFEFGMRGLPSPRILLLAANQIAN